jgi:hypothetical protein
MPNASLAAFLKLAGTVRSPKTGFPFEKIDSLIDGRAPNSYADQSDSSIYFGSSEFDAFFRVGAIGVAPRAFCQA